MSARKKPLSRPQPVPKKALLRAEEIDIPEDELQDAALSPERRRNHIILLVVGVLILGVSGAMAHGGTLAGWEHSVLAAVNGMSLPDWVTSQVAKPISNAVWGIMGLSVVLLCVPRYRLLAWQYLAAGAGAYILAFIVEHIIDRARPEVLTSDVIMRASQDGPGFPSGHVSVLAAVCAVLWLFVSWPWRILIVLFVIAEAWSRIFLGVHAPLDVIGAVGVALVVVSVMHLLPTKMRAFFRLHR
jgi:membrane-associated phospholipid phosphatase